MENLSTVERLKIDLRRTFRERAKAYGLTDAHSAAICQNLASILPKGAKIGSFMAKSDEPNLSGLSVRDDLILAYPVTSGTGLQFYKPTSSASFREGSFGIREPIVGQSEPIQIDDLDAVLVPGVAFDRRGGRLGRGKGFYDRALQKYRGLRVGVVTTAQMANEPLPMESHDVPVNLIVTDQFILRIFDT